MTAAADSSRAVSAMSSGLGVGSPDGWLCTTSRDTVPGVTHAGTNTSGIETGVLCGSKSANVANHDRHLVAAGLRC